MGTLRFFEEVVSFKIRRTFGFADYNVLGISKRTLQTYREKGLLPFSRIRHKIFYKPEDVGKLLQSSHYPNTAAL